jgi:predicted ATP-grasp superfamily ATP-dependent carboligase
MTIRDDSRRSARISDNPSSTRNDLPACALRQAERFGSSLCPVPVMRVFLYEHVTTQAACAARGLAPAPSESLLCEGRAMLHAVANDFAALPRVDLRRADATTLAGRSSRSEADVFRREAADADWTLVIAPELDGALAARCRMAVEAGGRLLGPGLALVELASHKHRAAEHLRRYGIATPHGRVLAVGEPLPRDFP